MDVSASDVAKKVTSLWGPLEEKLEPVREGVEELDDRLRKLVGSNPALTLFGALCAGYFVGRIIAKRS